MPNKLGEMPRVPWITEDGYLDLTKFPIDSVLTQALSTDPSMFRSGCVMLGSMQVRGRVEAGVFLVGLFYHWRDDIERLATIVEQLPQDCKTAEMLVGELYRVKSSNSSRRYLNAVIKRLTSYPRLLIEEHFARLSRDQFFSSRMRAKFRAILDELRYGRNASWE
ncbi:MAG: hypothetical protein NUW23_10675 [Firmicutes bacterium]|jgi:hypothetical protein|nr:hypothetical protein [Bacillota bacterium]